MAADAYAGAAIAYDSFAEDYDEWVGDHVSARRAKATAMSRVRAKTKPGDVVLDVGCGTGGEAISLARAGRVVVGVDVSARMLDVARGKIERAAVRDRVLVRPGAAGRASRDWLPPGHHAFDLAYSIFGVLNMEPDPIAALGAVGSLVRPGGHVVVGTLNPTPLYEIALWPLAGRLKPFRKAAAPVVHLRVGHGRDEAVACRLPSNRTFARGALAHGLTLEEQVGVHIFFPPPNDAIARRLPRFVSIANRIERRVESTAPFRALGYFSVLSFRKVEP